MIIFLVVFFSLACAQTPVLLSSVQSLTLKAGHHTTSRRGPPVPQLECTGGDCDRGAQHVKVMQCTNKGADSFGVPQWECKAELPSDWRLGTTDVSCEGYSSPEDPFILAGSCGVEYSIHGPPPKEPRVVTIGGDVNPKEEKPAELKGVHIPAKAPEERPVLTFDPNAHVWKPDRINEEEKPQKKESPRPPPVEQSSVWDLAFVLVCYLVGFSLFCWLFFLCCAPSTTAAVMAPQPRPAVVAPAPVSIPPPAPIYAHPAVVVTPMPTPAVPMAPVYPPPPPVCTMASAPVWSRSPSPVRHRRPRTPSPPRRREEPETPPAPVKTHTSTGYGTTKRR